MMILALLEYWRHLIAVRVRDYNKSKFNANTNLYSINKVIVGVCCGSMTYTLTDSLSW